MNLVIWMAADIQLSNRWHPFDTTLRLSIASSSISMAQPYLRVISQSPSTKAHPTTTKVVLPVCTLSMNLHQWWSDTRCTKDLSCISSPLCVRSLEEFSVSHLLSICYCICHCAKRGSQSFLDNIFNKFAVSSSVRILTASVSLLFVIARDEIILTPLNLTEKIVLTIGKRFLSRHLKLCSGVHHCSRLILASLMWLAFDVLSHSEKRALEEWYACWRCKRGVGEEIKQI